MMEPSRSICIDVASPALRQSFCYGHFYHYVGNYSDKLQEALEIKRYQLIDPHNNCHSMLLHAGSWSCLGGVGCWLYCLFVPILLTSKRERWKPEIIVISAIFGSFALLGGTLLSLAKLKSREIKRRAAIRNRDLWEQVNKIGDILREREFFAPDEPVSVSKIEEILTILNSVKRISRNWVVILRDDIDPDQLRIDAKLEIRRILNSLSYGQAYPLYKKFSADDDLKKNLKFIEKQKLKNLKMLHSCEKIRDPGNIALAIHFLEKEIFLREPELLDEFIGHLSEDVRDNERVREAYNRCLRQIRLFSPLLVEEENMAQVKRYDVDIVYKDLIFKTRRDKLRLCESFRPRLEPDIKFGKNTRIVRETDKLIIHMNDIGDPASFERLISSLNEGKLTFGEEYLPEMVEVADAFGVLPVLELCQIALLERLKSNLAEHSEDGWQESFEKVMEKGALSLRVKVKACALFRNMLDRRLKKRDWRGIEELFAFGRRYRSLEDCFHFFNPDMNADSITVEIAQIAFKYPLYDFQVTIRRLLMEKIARERDISTLFENFWAVGGVRDTLLEQVGRRLEKNTVRDIWELADRFNIIALKMFCLGFIGDNPQIIYEVWGIGDVPTQIAEYLIKNRKL